MIWSNVTLYERVTTFLIGILMLLPHRPRFEITIRSEGRKFKHVCAASEESEAVERIMRSYKKHDPEIISVKSLGALPTKLRR